MCSTRYLTQRTGFIDLVRFVSVDLTYQINVSFYKEEQQDAIMESLIAMFCKRHNKVRILYECIELYNFVFFGLAIK